MASTDERFVNVAGLRPDVADGRRFSELRSTSRFEVSVVVPTYRRPDELRRCLAGLANQSVSPAEIIVVRRTGDQATRLVLEEPMCSGVVDLLVSEPGVLAAMEAGAGAASRDIIAFVDDDAVPRPEWLERLVRHFDDPGVGGVGSRDVIAGQDAPTGPPLEVGTITRWGKLVGNHHLGAGASREVMVLKSVGVAFRRDALTLPRGLRGQGAQVHFEVGMSLSARRRGWRLVYDPSARVDHEIAPRFDADARGRPQAVAIRDAAYNLVHCLLTEMPDLFWRRAVYGLIVGDHDVPGVVRAAAAAVRGETAVLQRSVPSIKGQATALLRVRKSRSRGRLPPTAENRPRRPRVALLAHDIHDKGGMERACLELLKRGSQKVDFVVISSYVDPRVRSSVRWHRVRVPRRPFPLKFAAFYLLAGVRLARESVDLVHTVGAIVPNRVDIASVHFCHAGFHASRVERASPPSWIRRLNTGVSHRLALLTERWSYRRRCVRLLAAVSRGVKQELGRFYPGIEVVVTPNGVAHDRFSPDADAYHRTRQMMGVGSNDCVALFVGGDWDRKGLGIAIGGLSHAVSSGASLQLWVVGPGDRRRFEAMAVRLGVDPRVRFFGQRSETEVFYRAADIFVMPTLYETFCLAAFEAAACALPLVVTPVHGVKNLVDMGAAGVLTERTPEAVGTALVSLANDPSLRTSLGASAHRRSAEFTWQRSVDAVLASYAELLRPAESSTPSRPRR